mmetsp:Transcript_12584/g.24202  ORF Transcript_12584/g.24202 Transcript_12584/m.24202 type:complete len:230 (+) Transcript_12584:1223-1912(+)
MSIATAIRNMYREGLSLTLERSAAAAANAAEPPRAFSGAGVGSAQALKSLAWYALPLLRVNKLTSSASLAATSVETIRTGVAVRDFTTPLHLYSVGFRATQITLRTSVDKTPGVAATTACLYDCSIWTTCSDLVRGDNNVTIVPHPMLVAVLTGVVTIFWVGLDVGKAVGLGVRVGAKVGLLVAWHVPELVLVGPQLILSCPTGQGSQFWQAALTVPLHCLVKYWFALH